MKSENNIEQDLNGTEHMRASPLSMHRGCPPSVACKKAFVKQLAKNFNYEESTVSFNNGKFAVGINLSSEEFIFIMSNFDSKEEFEKMFVSEVLKR